jgi:thymidylate synthase (FAD)
MKATLVGYTVSVNLDAFSRRWNEENEEWQEGDAQLLMEAAGRLCYGSWHRPNADTATNETYLANIQDHKHFSVLEHGSASFLLTGISRSCSHQLCRHRHHSVSQLSERFVNLTDAEPVIPPAIREHVDADVLDRWLIGFAEAVSEYERIVAHLLSQGLRPKQAREAARCVMPSMTETKMVYTSNVRGWREMIEKRASVHADREIRAVAVEIFKQLVALWPNCFQDMELHTPDGHEAVRMKEIP